MCIRALGRIINSTDFFPKIICSCIFVQELLPCWQVERSVNIDILTPSSDSRNTSLLQVEISVIKLICRWICSVRAMH